MKLTHKFKKKAMWELYNSSNFWNLPINSAFFCQSMLMSSKIFRKFLWLLSYCTSSSFLNLLLAISHPILIIGLNQTLEWSVKRVVVCLFIMFSRENLGVIINLFLPMFWFLLINLDYFWPCYFPSSLSLWFSKGYILGTESIWFVFKIILHWINLFANKLQARLMFQKNVFSLLFDAIHLCYSWSI